MTIPEQFRIFVPGKGPFKPRIAFVGEAPSFVETQQLTPFVGPSGNFLNSILLEAGILRDNCWVTNVCKFMAPPNEKEGKPIPFWVRAKRVGIERDQQISNLIKELHEISPNIVVPLGETAFNALTNKKGIQSHRGSLGISPYGFKILPTYHPAHILHQEGESTGYWNKHVMVHDLRRALKHSFDKELRLPKRLLTVIKSSHQLQDFINRYKDYTKPAIDIEAMKCVPICVGISFTPSEGICVPLWNKFGISEMSDYEILLCWLMLAEFLDAHEIVGQNFGYDKDKLIRLGLKIKKLASDTMIKSFAINPELPKSLAFNTSIHTEEPHYKDEGMYEGRVEDLLIGCARDACVTKEVDLSMDNEIENRVFYERFLLPVYDLYGRMENVGFRVDEDARLELIKKYVQWHEDISYKLFNLTGQHVNTSSWQQVGKLLYDTLKIPARKGTSEEVLTQLLNGVVKKEVQKQAIELILEDRRVKKTISTYLLAPTDFDGRMRTSYFICLETGRSRTAQQEPPIRPKQKSGKKEYARGSAFQTMTKHGDIGADVRKIYVADEGHIFLQADSSQAEARVIFLLAEDYEALKLIDEIDYHALTATWFFGGTINDYSKKSLGYEHPIRFAGKTLRHAGHLGAKKRRAATEVNTQARKYKIDIRITEAKADIALKEFHKRQPKIQGVFQAGVIKCLEKNRKLYAPVPYGIPTNIGGGRIFFERWGDELFRQGFSYIPQRAVSENTKGAALRIAGSETYDIAGRAPWMQFIVESHDALLAQVPIEREQEAALILKEEMERPIDFSTCSLERGKLVIPCEIERGFNYKDLSKFKFLVGA